MTGAPIIGVIALSGIMPRSPGNRQIALHSSATIIPILMVAGSSCRWSSVLTIILAMCGTASPINAIGPQNAVAEAVSKPVIKSNLFRRALVFTPKFSAYCSPKSRVLRGFTNKSEHIKPTTVIVVKVGMWLIGTPPKFPNPHTI